MPDPRTGEKVEVHSRREWRAWLSENHGRTTGIWLVTYKKTADPLRHLGYDDLVDEAICFGWVDSQPRTVDDQRSMRWLAPRKPKSSWSAVNKARAERLSAAGLMHQSGLWAVDAAKRSGAWANLDLVESLVVPPDLQGALRRVPDALSNFDAFPRSSKRLILEWIGAAKQAETRAKRVKETAELAGQNIRANHYRQPKSAGPRRPSSA